ncbi:hypothetical protein HPB50_019674 [Hyalomma asiaticum]|uniref:Uncharacterized protein n=1 Tax=Hyalomma asiaticum TaxID=266040 RepID=A0ACB7S852_HYAAI|nr:hypothetical protein HPB50_019674 [Hyalomma asiaticum]
MDANESQDVHDHVEDPVSVDCVRNRVVVDELHPFQRAQLFDRASATFRTHAQAFERFEQSIPMQFRRGQLQQFQATAAATGSTHASFHRPQGHRTQSTQSEWCATLRRLTLLAQ